MAGMKSNPIQLYTSQVYTWDSWSFIIVTQLYTFDDSIIHGIKTTTIGLVLLANIYYKFLLVLTFIVPGYNTSWTASRQWLESTWCIINFTSHRTYSKGDFYWLKRHCYWPFALKVTVYARAHKNKNKKQRAGKHGHVKAWPKSPVLILVIKAGQFIISVEI